MKRILSLALALCLVAGLLTGCGNTGGTGSSPSGDIRVVFVPKLTGNAFNEYTRIYAEALLNRQDLGKVDAIAGATHSHGSFQQLAEVAIQQALLGDENVVFVNLTRAVGECKRDKGAKKVYRSESS